MANILSFFLSTVRLARTFFLSFLPAEAVAEGRASPKLKRFSAAFRPILRKGYSVGGPLPFFLCFFDRFVSL